ncbi:MAG: TetR/AcrR family transcriptional regulator [Spirochaetaceae bacterium]
MTKAQFNREDVIQKTIELFWLYGYSGASMQQVVKATGLKPGSIYLAFGSKEGLFREALESYSKKSLLEMVVVMDGEKTVGEGICKILRQLIDNSSKEEYSSCFLLKTQLELGYNGTDLDDLAGYLLNEREVIFQYYLGKEYDVDLSKSRAISIMLHVYGLLAYGYQKKSPESMLSGLKEGLPWLPW